MTQARIEVNGVAGSDNDLPISTLVQLSNQDTGGELTYLWAVLDQPEGGADALSSTVIENPTITITLEGTYLLSLIVNEGLPDEKRDRVILGVRQLRSNERVPAALETLEDDLTKGWKLAANRLLQRVDQLTADANIVVAVNNTIGALATGRIVYFSSNNFLATNDEVLGVTPADADTPTTINSTLGIVIGTPAGGGSAGASQPVLVRIFGLYENLSVGAATAEGDPVYVSNSGAASLTPGTYPRIIGRVTRIDDATHYRWIVEGTQGFVMPRVVNPVTFETTDASWTIVNSSTDGLFWQTTAQVASGLVVPIPLNLGEMLYKLTLDIYQGNTTSRMTCALFAARAFAGSGFVYAPQQTPATAGLQSFDYTDCVSPGPISLAPGESLYMHVIGSGGGASSRNVGAVTAWVRPSNA